MAVGDMMHELADCPALGAIRCVELRLSEARDRGPQLRRCSGDIVDPFAEITSAFELPDGISRIVHNAKTTVQQNARMSLRLARGNLPLPSPAPGPRSRSDFSIQAWRPWCGRW